MHRPPVEQQLLLALQMGALIALCVRIWWTGLHRTYRYFFGYLAADLLQTVVLSVVPFDSLAYRNIWLLSEGVVVCFYVLVVLELYSVILQDLAGIATFSRRYIQIALGVAIFVSLLLLFVEKNETSMVARLFTFERAVVFSLVLFVLFLTAFLVYYPVPLKRNVIIYSSVYAVYFLTKAGSIFIINLGYYANRVMANIWMIVFFSCLLIWLFALNRSGEAKTVVLGHQWSSEDEERLLAQLKSINATLARSAQKGSRQNSTAAF